MRMTLCLAPELKANPCWEGVYLMYCAAWGFCATWVGCAAAILVVTSFSNASLVFLVVYKQMAKQLIIKTRVLHVASVDYR